MPVRVKPIIPSRLGLLEPRAAERAVNEAGEEAAERARDRFKKLLKGWKHKVDFKIEKKGYTWVVSTNDEIFFYQDEGTDPHVIRPKRKRALYWKGARHPVRVVHHPGTEPQDFTGQVQAFVKGDFKQLMDEELRAAQG